jgi:glycosyltransferase involved in cell wall biosynthesis
MKILLIAPMLPHAEGLGAVPALLHAQIAALSERHDVTLVAGVGNELGEDEAARALLREYSDIHLTDRRPALSGPRRLQRRFRLAATWARRRWPWRTVWFADPGMQTVVDRLCRERSFDVIAVEDSSMAMFRLPEGLPKVLTEHEVRRAHDLASKPRHARDWPLWALQARDARRWESFQPAAWRRFDRIQVFTEGDARALKERAPEIASRVTVNPFGIVIPEAADPTREVPATAIFIGNFTHPPNRDAVLWLTREIMPAVLERKPDARLCIVGYSPPREVRELAGPEIEVAADVPAVQP